MRWVLLVILLLAGCAESQESNFEQQEPIVLKTSTAYKIDDAFSQGKIDEKQAMVLNLVSGYEQEKLPESFTGESTGRGNLQQAELWLIQNYDSLDEETKEAVKPYYVLPNDPESYINKENSKIVEYLSIIPSVKAAPIWHLIEVDGAEIYHLDGAKGQAEIVKKAFKKSDSKHSSLLGIDGYEKVLFFIVPMSDYGSAGYRTKDGEEYGLIKIRQGMGVNDTRGTVAHELFHTFQFKMGLKDFRPENDWVLESTATWSENYVYPEANSEHIYLTRFYKNLGKEMIGVKGTREYQGYTWPLFLEQYYDDEDMITTLLLNTKSVGGREAAKAIENFDLIFQEYGKWNINYYFAKFYEDTPEFPGNALSVFDWNFLGNEGLTDIDLKLEPLSFQYVQVEPYRELEDIELLLPVLPEHVRIRAFVKVDGEWREEDWTGAETMAWCRKSQNMQEAILIFSNLGDSPYEGQMQVDVRKECNPTWHGKTHVYWDHTYEYNHITRRTTGRYIAYDKIVMDEGSAVVVSTDVEYERLISERKDYQEYGGYAGMVWEEDVRRSRGSARDVFEYDDHVRWGVDEGKVGFSIEIAPDKEFIQKTRTVRKARQVDGKVVVDTKTYNRTSDRINIDAIEISDVPRDNEFSGTEMVLISTDDFGEYMMTVEYDYEYS